MCGIAGLIRYGSRSEENIERMKKRMVHRGPDAEGTWHNEEKDVWFGHRRLAILDLTETGAQPMTSRSGKKTIVYNGEIYNYLTLKEALKAHGVDSFRGGSDTEVILEAFDTLGYEETLRQMKGMFAIAVYEHDTGDIYLMRDRVGEKPLYYGFVGDAFAFASEIGCIAEIEGFSNPIHKEVLPIYFSHGYIPAPYTIYEGIRKLEPGKMLVIRRPYKAEDISTRTYWSMKEVALHGQAHPFAGSFEEASLELERLLKASVREQMLSSDVPVGAFLSSGIDSSTVVALMQAQSDTQVRSFTIGMKEPDFNEADAAREIARHLGTKHTEQIITEEDCKQVIPLLPSMFGEPFADSSQIPTYLVSKLTRESVTVSLSGDAGDELFCGYNSYKSIEWLWKKLKMVPTPFRRMGGALWGALPLPKREYAKLAAARSPEEVYRLTREREALVTGIPLDKTRIPFAYTEIGHNNFNDPNHGIMLMDLLMYHPDDILVKVDRAAMAVSLESRVPMLDKDVVEFAWTLPLSYVRTFENGERIGKRILKDVLYRYVPKELLDRPKKGFSIPIMKWLKEPGLREWAEDLLDEGKIRAQGLLDAGVVREIWRDFIENDHWRDQIWFLLMFQAWYENEYKHLAG
ncbi:MAG: asparagine synthase (glutamine-hydrolyzing) [Lachnospiraceae bacterium]|nr:asparagine synthase (glutamine-hydrolyzing) [Lachnospiraceae bacterium]